MYLFPPLTLLYESRLSIITKSQHYNEIPKLLLQKIKYSPTSMGLSSVLHEPHLVEISASLDNGDEIIFQNLQIPFSSQRSYRFFRDWTLRPTVQFERPNVVSVQNRSEVMTIFYIQLINWYPLRSEARVLVCVCLCTYM